MLSGTCQIRTVTLSADGYGGQSESVSDGSSIRCHLDVWTSDRTEQEQMFGLLQGRQGGRLHLPSGTSVSPSDRIVHQGITWEVLAIEAPSGLEPIRSIIVGRFT